MTLCNGCNRPHPQTTIYLTDDLHLLHLCSPCWIDQDYWDSIGPSYIAARPKGVAA